MRTTSALVAFFVLTLAAGTVRADDTAVADALFAEGKALTTEGKFNEACPKFEASLAAARTLGTLLNLADCWGKIGRVASAERTWADAVTLAKEAGDDRAVFAEEQRALLAPRVPKLTLNVKSGAEPLTIRLAGQAFPEARWGLPVAQDPGKVALEILRGEEVLEKRELDLAEGAKLDVPVDLGAIALAHPKKDAKPAEEPPGPGHAIAGWVTLGVGLGAVAAFGILEGVALSQRSSADEVGGCLPKGEEVICSQQGYDLVQRAGDFAEVGQWLGVGGALVFGVGLTLVLTAPSGDPEEAGASASIAPVLWPGGGGFFAAGRF